LSAPPSQAAPWKIGLALSVVYLSWGTTYLAIQEGVKTLPPCLFGGVRIGLAGLLLLGYLGLRGQQLQLPWREAGWFWLMSVFMFVGGNGLINVAEKSVASGVASVLVATTPLFMALLEAAVPWGERLKRRAWLGLLLGLAGVAVLFSGRFHGHENATHWAGLVLVLGSALCWAIGAFLHRHHRTTVPHLVVAGYQMLLGGASVSLVGVLVGELGQLTPGAYTSGAVFAFFYLLVVGSLMGFLTFVWLLRHVSAALAGTYAYVNPVVALFVGWLLAGEGLSLPVLAGMLIILAGVTLVRSGQAPRLAPISCSREAPAERVVGRDADCGGPPVMIEIVTHHAARPHEARNPLLCSDE